MDGLAEIAVENTLPEHRLRERECILAIERALIAEHRGDRGRRLLCLFRSMRGLGEVSASDRLSDRTHRADRHALESLSRRICLGHTLSVMLCVVLVVSPQIGTFHVVSAPQRSSVASMEVGVVVTAPESSFEKRLERLEQAIQPGGMPPAEKSFDERLRLLEQSLFSRAPGSGPADRPG
ncbi:MAG: hypothetical protein AAF196_17875 [Planctomycetota bacterium]